MRVGIKGECEVSGGKSRRHKRKLLVFKIRVVVVFAACRFDNLSGEIAVAHVIPAMSAV